MSENPQDYEIFLDNVHKAFGSHVILNGITLKAVKGETLVIIGGSGTGKSVTLKHIVRILTPDKGRVFVDNVELSKPMSKAQIAQYRLKIGYLFQSGALINWLTVYDNVALPLRENTGVFS